MPSIPMSNARGDRFTATELGAFELLLRRGYNPQTGTIADARTLFTGQPATPAPLEATADAVNVARYGATGDSVTDDTTAFQAAVNSVQARGGGVVNVPDGTYRLGTVAVSGDDVEIRL